ncbi:Smr/MutS family protein [Sphingomonas suaedae]|uniref:Smr/MutS family protein n=1 Tax=Sphingomonas suaedae TaxID=2599297 RepID=A0A518RL17_9SPHN|nr:Smr/MutS family protein [Sphingomonas suaedae]
MKPIAKRPAGPASSGEGLGVARPRLTETEVRVERPQPNPSPKGEGLKKAPLPPPPRDTLDGGWDKRLSRGLVVPDATLDLHGHTLASAHALLDRGLDRAIVRGDRLLLLITGKPPREESDRPHARGAIRAAVRDWLAASRHADRIAAVRGAHPRHGGQGALYIVFRRDRSPARKF